MKEQDAVLSENLYFYKNENERIIFSYLKLKLLG